MKHFLCFFSAMLIFGSCSTFQHGDENEPEQVDLANCTTSTHGPNTVELTDAEEDIFRYGRFVKMIINHFENSEEHTNEWKIAEAFSAYVPGGFYIPKSDLIHLLNDHCSDPLVEGFQFQMAIKVPLEGASQKGSAHAYIRAVKKATGEEDGLVYDLVTPCPLDCVDSKGELKKAFDCGIENPFNFGTVASHPNSIFVASSPSCP